MATKSIQNQSFVDWIGSKLSAFDSIANLGKVINDSQLLEVSPKQFKLFLTKLDFIKEKYPQIPSEVEIYKQASELSSEVDIMFLDFVINPQPRTLFSGWKLKDEKTKGVDPVVKILDLALELAQSDACPPEIPKALSLVAAHANQKIKELKTFQQSKGTSEVKTFKEFIKKWIPSEPAKKKEGGRPILDPPYLVAHILEQHFLKTYGKPSRPLIGKILVRIFPKYITGRYNNAMKGKGRHLGNRAYKVIADELCRTKKHLAGAYPDFLALYKSYSGRENPV